MKFRAKDENDKLWLSIRSIQFQDSAPSISKASRGDRVKATGGQSIRNLQEVGVNVLHREKEKEGGSHYKIINLDRGAIREALRLYSGRPVYLYCKEKRESGKKVGVIGKKVKKQINS